MKKLIYTTLAMVMLSGCGKDKIDNENKTDVKDKGTVSFNLSTDGGFITFTKAEPVVSDFSVKIVDNSNTTIKSWTKFSEVTGVIELNSGEYAVEAASGVEQDAAYEAPYYYGRKSFVVNVQELTAVDVVCELANVKVTVAFSDKLKNTIDNPTVSITNGDAGTLIWNPSETRAGYFKTPSTGKLTVIVKGTRKDNGSAVTQAYHISSVAARQWHKINVGINTTGTAGLGLLVKSDLIELDSDINIPDGDDIIDNNGDNGKWDEEPTPDPDPTPDPTPDPEAKVPTIVGASLNGQPFDLANPVVLPENLTALDVVFTSEAAGGIQSLTLIVESVALKDMFDPTVEMDLANYTNESWAGVLQGVGILDASKPIKGQNTFTFSVGSLVPLLAGLDGGPGNDHKFKLKVKDANGEASAVLNVRVPNN